MGEKYDEIGQGYNLSRSADHYLSQQILKLLDPKADGQYLEIGCGTGNYTNRFQEAGFSFIGIDPSKEMLEQAKAVNSNINWKIGTAENTGLEDKSIDGIVAFLTIHHWPDLSMAFSELNRILKNDGTIVLFTSLPDQMKGYWLCHYFPAMLRSGIDQMPSLSTLTDAFERTGFSISGTEKYFVQPQLEDLFLYSGKHNPGIYFHEQVRKGISTFSDLANLEEVERGLILLRQDIESGKVNEIIDSYENQKGDYLLLSIKKA